MGRSSSGPSPKWFVLIAAVGLGAAAGCRAQQQDTVRAEGGQQTAEERWTGVRFPPMPAGVTTWAANALGTPGSEPFSIQEVTAEGVRMAWMSRGVEPLGRGYLFSVVDVLAIPELAQGRTFIIGLCGELAEGAPARPEPEDLATDAAFMAIARFQDLPVLTEIEQAWRAERDELRIVPIAAQGIACLNELYEL